MIHDKDSEINRLKNDTQNNDGKIREQCEEKVKNWETKLNKLVVENEKIVIINQNL